METVKEVLAYLWKRTKRRFRKIKRGIKKYFRALIRHTQKGDYSILLYTIIALIILILLIVLLSKAIGGKDKEKATTTTEITTTEEISTETSEEELRNQLVTRANEIYQTNQALLILVNAENPLDPAYTFTHKTLNCGEDIDDRIYENLKNLLQACNDANNEYNIIKGYIQAETSSDHGTGLGIDITDLNTTDVTNYSAENATDAWLLANCYTYGFIPRYPADKASVTGVSNEPYHFRYVGAEAAAFMQQNNLTLEEFHALLVN